MVVELPDGTYDATVQLIEWDAEQDMKLENGTPGDGAPQDFVVAIVPNRSNAYRTDLIPFDA